MLVYSSTVSEVLTHVYNTLAGQVSRKIISDMGLTEYLGNRIYIRSDYLGASRSNNTNQLPILHENAFQCNIKYSANPFGLKWDSTTPGQHMDPALHRRDNMVVDPLFYEPLHNILLTERYLPCNIELECSFTFLDKVVAFDVMSKFLSTYVRGELLMVNNLSYDYKLPMDVLSRLHTLGQLINIPRGHHMEWLKKYSNDKIQRIVSTRSANRHAEIVVKKDIWETLTAIDYTPDQPAVQGMGISHNTVVMNFTATLQFGRVNMLYLKYPLVVNNVLVPDALVPVVRTEAFGRIIRYLEHPYRYLDSLYQEYKFLQNKPVRQPWYDDWYVPRCTLHNALTIKPFFIGVVTLDMPQNTIDLTGTYTEIDLTKDLDQYALAPKVLSYFDKYKSSVLDVSSEYSVSVFVDDTQVSSSILEFDGKILRIPNTLGHERIYRVVLANRPNGALTNNNPWFINDLIFTIDVYKEQ